MDEAARAHMCQLADQLQTLTATEPDTLAKLRQAVGWAEDYLWCRHVARRSASMVLVGSVVDMGAHRARVYLYSSPAPPGRTEPTAHLSLVRMVRDAMRGSRVVMLTPGPAVGNAPPPLAPPEAWPLTTFDVHLNAADDATPAAWGCTLDPPFPAPVVDEERFWRKEEPYDVEPAQGPPPPPDPLSAADPLRNYAPVQSDSDAEAGENFP